MKALSTVRLSDYREPGEPRINVLSSRHAGTNPHDHDYYELVYIEEGTGLHDMDGRMNLVMSGDMLILSPGVAHRYIGESAMRLYNCMFDLSALRPDEVDCSACDLLCRLLPRGAKCAQAHLELNEQERVKAHMARMQEAGREKAFCWRSALTCELVLLMLDCARIFERYAPEGGEPNRYVGYATSAMRYIDAHFAEGITVSEVAASVGLSPDYLTRQFKLVTGLAPVAYLRRYRLARAMELLCSGETVTETARRVGFQSLAHFSREFKQELETTPSQYRKKHLSEDRNR